MKKTQFLPRGFIKGMTLADYVRINTEPEKSSLAVDCESHTPSFGGGPGHPEPQDSSAGRLNSISINFKKGRKEPPERKPNHPPRLPALRQINTDRIAGNLSTEGSVLCDLQRSLGKGVRKHKMGNKHNSVSRKEKFLTELDLLVAGHKY